MKILIALITNLRNVRYSFTIIIIIHSYCFFDAGKCNDTAGCYFPFQSDGISCLNDGLQQWTPLGCLRSDLNNASCSPPGYEWNILWIEMFEIVWPPIENRLEFGSTVPLIQWLATQKQWSVWIHRRQDYNLNNGKVSTIFKIFSSLSLSLSLSPFLTALLYFSVPAGFSLKNATECATCGGVMIPYYQWIPVLNLPSFFILSQIFL
jgi:hypothetical protein